MKIEIHKAVSISYTLKDNEGKVLDSADKASPFTFIYGTGGVIPGLEKELDGKVKGDSFKLHLNAADAYGEYSDKLLQNVSIEMFEGLDAEDLFEGAQFHAETNQGMQVVTIKEINGDKVLIDGNHPMAGKELNFDVVVEDIRDTTEEELEHGHIHAEGESCGGGNN